MASVETTEPATSSERPTSEADPAVTATEAAAVLVVLVVVAAVGTDADGDEGADTDCSMIAAIVLSVWNAI